MFYFKTKGSTVTLIKNGKEVLNNCCVLPVEIDKFIYLNEDLKTAFVFQMLYNENKDFDKSLGFFQLEKKQIKPFLENLKKTFVLLSKYTGYESESDLRIVSGILLEMIENEVSYDIALANYCKNTGSAMKAISQWFPYEFFRNFKSIDAFFWVQKRFL